MPRVQPHRSDPRGAPRQHFIRARSPNRSAQKLKPGHRGYLQVCPRTVSRKSKTFAIGLRTLFLNGNLLTAHRRLVIMGNAFPFKHFHLSPLLRRRRRCSKNPKHNSSLMMVSKRDVGPRMSPNPWSQRTPLNYGLRPQVSRLEIPTHVGSVVQEGPKLVGLAQSVINDCLHSL